LRIGPAVASAALSCFLGTFEVAAQTPAAPPRTAPVYQPNSYVGPANCASSNCHGKPEPSNEYDVLQNEYTTWNTLGTDPHRGAHAVLSNEESKQIARNMKLGDPATSPTCLSCHSLVVDQAKQAHPIRAADGVTCEACHGPAGGWLDEHSKKGWTHARSVERGMTDLRAPEIRARNCLECHLGSPRSSVDHELLAAGHPELRFELDAYTEAMNPHWDPFVLRSERPGRPKTHGARAWAVGQVEAARQALLQLVRRSQSEKWPEFTEMSCDPCHHSLSMGEARQIRGYETDVRPGLPRFSPARWAVTRHVVRSFAPAEIPALDKEIAEIQRDVARMQPRETVASAAQRAVAALDRAMPRVKEASLSTEELRRLLTAILGDARDARSRAMTDLRSAEQACFSIQALLLELEDDGIPVSTEIKKQAQELFLLLDTGVPIRGSERHDFDRRGLAGAFDELARELDLE
jgi:hypothetical protein